MSNHSAGVILGKRAAGGHYYRDEIGADGGKRYLHHRVRLLEEKAWRREFADWNEAVDDADGGR